MRLELENVALIYKNFRGAPGKFNKEGERSFSVIIPEEMVNDLRADGWNVRERTYGDENEKFYHLPVNVRYSQGRGPAITKLSGGYKTPISEETVEMLDYLPIESVDLVINPYEYSVQGRSGISAYLHQMFVVVEETKFDRKYADYGEE